MYYGKPSRATEKSTGISGGVPPGYQFRPLLGALERYMPRALPWVSLNSAVDRVLLYMRLPCELRSRNVADYAHYPFSPEVITPSTKKR